MENLFEFFQLCSFACLLLTNLWRTILGGPSSLYILYNCTHANQLQTGHLCVVFALCCDTWNKLHGETNSFASCDWGGGVCV